MDNNVIKCKADLISSMNCIVTNLNNEDAYSQWIYIVPDCADADDFQSIAEDEELFVDAINSFKDIIHCYLKDGIYINKKLY